MAARLVHGHFDKFAQARLAFVRAIADCAERPEYIEVRHHHALTASCTHTPSCLHTTTLPPPPPPPPPPAVAAGGGRVHHPAAHGARQGVDGAGDSGAGSAAHRRHIRGARQRRRARRPAGGRRGHRARQPQLAHEGGRPRGALPRQALPRAVPVLHRHRLPARAGTCTAASLCGRVPRLPLTLQPQTKHHVCRAHA